MKTMLSSRRDHYLAKFSIFFITVALIAGMVGCDGPIAYDLTISISSTAEGISITAGGNVTATANEEETVISPGDEKTIRDLPEGTVVDLVATPDAGYRFVEWTGRGANTVADNYSAATTITMSGRYSTIPITAKFVQGIEIRDWNDLNAIRSNLKGSHILMNALNSTTSNYTDLASPIANYKSGWLPFGSFSGTFDGQGHEIRDLFIMSDRPAVGLFSHVEDGGFVQDVRVTNANVTGEDYVGGLVGENYGTVSSSNFTGSVTSEQGSNIGGLVGINYGGTVSNSYSSGSVTSDKGSYIGGLVGKNDGGTVSDSQSAGSVSGNENVGGLVGENYEGTVGSSYSTGSVSGVSCVGGLVGGNEDNGVVRDSYSKGSVNGITEVGGLVGGNEDNGVVRNSYSTGSVNGTGEHVGGLVGWNEGTVSSNSSSTGNVKGNNNVGGLVGYNYIGSTVKESYSTGNVIGINQHVGGLVGWNEGTVEKCYSSSTVNGSLCVGGLVGGNEDNGIVRNSYSTGSVSGTTGVGGLVGENRYTVSSNSYSIGNVTGHTHVGGLVGQNDHIVAKCHSTSKVTGHTHVGGLVGYNKGSETKVSDSYSTGSVNGTHYVGGLVGYNDQGTVETSYSIGSVTGSSQVGIGGLVGWKTMGKVLYSFWDKETSVIEVSPGGGVGLPLADMQLFATFDNAGWSICEAPTNDTCTWYITSGDYPRHEQPV